VVSRALVVAALLSLAAPASAQEAVAKAFPPVFRWCNGPVIDTVVTSESLAAMVGVPLPLTIVAATIYYQPAPGPWPATGEVSISVDVGTAFWNSAKNYPPGQQHGPIDRLNLLAFAIITPRNTGNDQKDVRAHDPPVVLRAGDAILLDYNCTGDPGNYTVGMNVAWGIKYRMP